MTTTMLSSHPTTTPNSVVPSYAFFIHRQRPGCLLTVYTIHHQDSAPFPGALDVSRPDWQTSSAIISSRAIAASGSSSDKSPAPSDDPFVVAPENDNGGLTNHRLPTAIKGTSTGSMSLTARAAAAGALDLVLISNLPRSLIIANLSPGPMHRSRLRMVYQGVSGAYSEATTQGILDPGDEPPQALAQCERTLTRLGLNNIHEAFDDTTDVAEYVANNRLRESAAIAGAHHLAHQPVRPQS
ncbi:hypothetical protein Cni_G05546 [Canna indica]|uniref:Uncharacterized protein n=1 Tax=Canna indica TaxID=4628 RepID=A0AAQ3JWT5_9LILI|nr:hypothetical protein Cni_G05546 [Canna indica]